MSSLSNAKKINMNFYIYTEKRKFQEICKVKSRRENRNLRMHQVRSGHLQEVRQWKIINRQAQKVVALAYRRWSFTRGSNCKVFWIGGRLWEVVIYGDYNCNALTGKILVF